MDSSNGPGRLSKKAEINNWEIVMLALDRTGGSSRHVHTEDVALKCFELAKDAFSWLKHAQYPDKEPVRRDLTRIREGQYGASLATGRAGVPTKDADGNVMTDGWQLTEAGVRWIGDNGDRICTGLGLRGVKTHRREDLRALQWIIRHPLHLRYDDNSNTFTASIGELADMLRCRVDSDDNVWNSRFTTIRNQAIGSGQDRIAEFIDACDVIRDTL